MTKNRKCYGRATVLGDSTFKPLIEYTEIIRSYCSGSAEYTIQDIKGRDLINGIKYVTSQFGLLSSALASEGYKKNTLYVTSVEPLSKEDMLKELKSLDNEDIDRYVNKSYEVLNYYFITNCGIKTKKETQELQRRETIDNSLKKERKRIKGIYKTVR